MPSLVFVSEYEAAMADMVQDDAELATAYSAPAAARRRLSERFKNRGFWPTNPAKGKFSKGSPKILSRVLARAYSNGC